MYFNFHKDNVIGVIFIYFRYVQEWLNAMINFDIVTYHEAKGLYSLSADRLAEIENVAYFSNWMTTCVLAYPVLKEAFKKDGPNGMRKIYAL